jgi:hypothetical protein
MEGLYRQTGSTRLHLIEICSQVGAALPPLRSGDLLTVCRAAEG